MSDGASEHSMAFPPELAEFLLGQQYAALLHATNQGTVLVVKMPRYEIASVRGRVPIEIRHELYMHPAAPVIRMVTRIFDRHDSSLALETYVNVEDEVQRTDYATLRHSSRLLMLFYDELVTHQLTKQVDGIAPEVIHEVLRHADQLLAAIPVGLRNFDQAKAEILRHTQL